MIDVKRVGWGCTSCATRYVLKLTRCPRCHGVEFTRGEVILPPPVVEPKPAKRAKAEAA